MTLIVKIKVFVAKLLVNNFVGTLLSSFYSNKIPFRNLIIDISEPIIKKRIASALFFKTYESSEIRYVSKYIHNYQGTIIELGGSIGVMSSFAAKSNPLARVLSFEADKRFIPIIENNYTINNIENAQCFFEIIGSEGYEFMVGDDNTMGKITKTDSPVGEEMSSLSSLLVDHKVEDYILISDIEGAEYFLLQEKEEVFERCSLIIMEMHTTDIGDKIIIPEDLIQKVRKLGYTIVEQYGPNIVAKRNIKDPT